MLEFGHRIKEVKDRMLFSLESNINRILMNNQFMFLH